MAVELKAANVVRVENSSNDLREGAARDFPLGFATLAHQEDLESVNQAH